MRANSKPPASLLAACRKEGERRKELLALSHGERTRSLPGCQLSVVAVAKSPRTYHALAQIVLDRLRQPARVAVGLEQVPAQAVGVADEVQAGKRSRPAGGEGRLATRVQRAGQVDQLLQ